MDLKTLFYIVSTITPAIAMLLGRKASRHPMFYYATLALLTEFTTIILKQGLSLPILWIGNCFLALELYFFALFFQKTLRPKNTKIYWSVVVMLLLWFLGSKMDSHLMEFNRLGASLLCVLYTIVCLASYRKILQRQRHQFIEHSSSFWILNGIFIYASTTSIVWGIPEIFKTEPEFVQKTWSYFYLAINSIRYILIGIGLRLYAKYGD